MERGYVGLSWRYANPTIFFKGVLCFQCNNISFSNRYLALFHEILGNLDIGFSASNLANMIQSSCTS